MLQEVEFSYTNTIYIRKSEERDGRGIQKLERGIVALVCFLKSSQDETDKLSFTKYHVVEIDIVKEVTRLEYSVTESNYLDNEEECKKYYQSKVDNKSLLYVIKEVYTRSDLDSDFSLKINVQEIQTKITKQDKEEFQPNLLNIAKNIGINRLNEKSNSDKNPLYGNGSSLEGIVDRIDEAFENAVIEVKS